MRSDVSLRHRNDVIHTALAAWEITVASAAPRTPRFSAKMNTGSNAMLMAAPIRIESIATRDCPCAVMNGFRPSVSCTNTVPIK